MKRDSSLGSKRASQCFYRTSKSAISKQNLEEILSFSTPGTHTKAHADSIQFCNHSIGKDEQLTHLRFLSDDKMSQTISCSWVQHLTQIECALAAAQNLQNAKPTFVSHCLPPIIIQTSDRFLAAFAQVQKSIRFSCFSMLSVCVQDARPQRASLAVNTEAHVDSCCRAFPIWCFLRLPQLKCLICLHTVSFLPHVLFLTPF